MEVSMDQLTASLDAHCDVATNPFDINRPHPRFSEYSHLREPASLMGDQNKRRAEFLERQKSKRESLVNLRRGLEEVSETKDDSGNQEAATSTSEASHQFANIPSSISSGSKWTFTHQLMMSEWLVDVPPDLEENWLVKPCPKGRRIMIVAHKGWTKAYSKAGHLVATFKSELPCGNNSSRCITILDCVWNWQNRTYYVLDVLAWNNIVLLDCETEFRFYWLKVKLDEIPEAKYHTETNNFAFLSLPFFECKQDQLTELMSNYPMFSEGNDPGLDGMLFYHKNNLYEHGSTPLVTWIKPFMMENVLGVKVNEGYMEGKPEGYNDQAAYIREFEQNALARRNFFHNRGHTRWHRGGPRNQGRNRGEKAGDGFRMDEDPDH